VTDGTFRAPTLTAELARRSRARDVALLLAVPALLVLVWAAGDPLRSVLVLRPEAPTVLAAATTHLVHASAGHLLGNVAVYLGAVGVGYALAVLGGRRRHYLTLVAGVVLAFPLVISGFHLAVLRTGSIVGFSGVALGVVGLLPWVLVEFLRARVSGAVDLADVPGVALLGVAAIGWASAGTVEARLLVVGVAAVGLLALVPAVRRVHRSTAAGGDARRLGPPSVGPVGVVFAAVALAMPSSGTEPAVTAALALHLLGYGLAVVGATGAGHYRQRRPRPSPPPAHE
jgi:hypothetical protein